MKAHGNFREIQLDNKYGLKDQYVIAEAEALFSTMAAIEGIPDGGFDIEHYQAIHKHVLGDMYDWAGEFRTAKISVGADKHESTAPPALVEFETARALEQLRNEKIDGMTVHEFADRMADHYTRLYLISPFPDGNARATRYLLDKFAEQNDLEIRWEEIPADAFATAVDRAVAGNRNGLKALMRQATDYCDLFDMYNVESIQSKVGDIVQNAGLNERMMPSQPIITHGDLQKMATFAKLEITKDLERFTSGQSTNRDWMQTSASHDMEHQHDRLKGHQMLNDAITSMSSAKPRTPGMG